MDVAGDLWGAGDKGDDARPAPEIQHGDAGVLEAREQLDVRGKIVEGFDFAEKLGQIRVRVEVVIPLLFIV